MNNNNNNNNNQLQNQKERQNALLQKDITDTVLTRLEVLQKEGVVIPPNYNAQNALKSAFFALTNSSNGNLLEKCTQTSIANSLLDMVIQGLSPAKTQCYFVPYGDTCKMTRSYFGTQKVIKSLSNVKDIYANVIFEGDEFEYKNEGGRDYLVNHKSSLLNRDKPIVGAYAVVEMVDGDKPITIMTRKEIETSWKQSKIYGKTHNAFPQEMAKRTVINRAAKSYINTSDDSDILVQSINQSTENEYEDSRIDKANAIDAEIKEQANTQEFVEEDIPQVPQATWPQIQQASQQVQQAPQAAVQPKSTPEQQTQQSQEPIWNL